MNPLSSKENIYRTHNGLKRDFDETKLDEMIKLLEKTDEAFSQFYDISRKAIFRKSRSNKMINIGACISAVKAELTNIKDKLSHN